MTPDKTPVAALAEALHPAGRHATARCCMKSTVHNIVGDRGNYRTHDEAEAAHLRYHAEDAEAILPALPEGWHLTNAARDEGLREALLASGPFLRWEVDGIVTPFDAEAFIRRALATGESRDEEKAAGWLVDLCTVVEIADQKVEQDFDTRNVQVRRADWNRIVAVARGHTSDKAREQIERFRARSFALATGESSPGEKR